MPCRTLPTRGPSLQCRVRCLPAALAVPTVQGAVHGAGTLRARQEGAGLGWSRARCRAARFPQLPPAPGSPAPRSRLLAPTSRALRRARTRSPVPSPARIRPRIHPCPGRHRDQGGFVPSRTGRDLFVSRCRFRQPFLYFRFLPAPAEPNEPAAAVRGRQLGLPAAGPARERLCSAGTGAGSAPRGRPAAPGRDRARDRVPGAPQPSEVSGDRVSPPPPPSPPMGPPNLSWLGSGSGRSKSPALGSAPGDRRPRRPLDPNRWGAAKGRPRRASATRPRRDPHPVVPAGTLGGWKGRQPRATRREGRSPGHSPWKSESLGTSIPARIQCSSGKEPATAAFRCSAPGGGRWGTPV